MHRSQTEIHTQKPKQTDKPMAKERGKEKPKKTNNSTQIST